MYAGNIPGGGRVTGIAGPLTSKLYQFNHGTAAFNGTLPTRVVSFSRRDANKNKKRYVLMWFESLIVVRANQTLHSVYLTIGISVVTCQLIGYALCNALELLQFV